MEPQPVMNSQVNTIEPNIKNNKAKFYIIGGLLFIVGAVLGLFLGKMVYSKNNQLIIRIIILIIMMYLTIMVSIQLL